MLCGQVVDKVLTKSFTGIMITFVSDAEVTMTVGLNQFPGLKPNFTHLDTSSDSGVYRSAITTITVIHLFTFDWKGKLVKQSFKQFKLQFDRFYFALFLKNLNTLPTIDFLSILTS